MKSYLHGIFTGLVLLLALFFIFLFTALLQPPPVPTVPARNYVLVKITGYSNDPISINVPKWRDGFTATMTKAQVGVCASDWSVFPVGTVIEVPGYGRCRIEDRGGLVTGNHIDLFFNTYKEARAWGVQYAPVEIIG